jgi:XTP/dITP diphosphohydrolase
VKRLILGTNNPHKVVEVRAVLADLTDWDVQPQPAAIAEIAETGATFAECAIQKAVHVSRHVQDFVLADDSGLCVDALKGRPGVLSKRYAPSDNERIARLLHELEGVEDPQRSARFICALALASNGEVVWTGEGCIEGTIIHEPRGANGFGYDPIFWLPEFNRTLAELAIEQKNAVSHRGRALQLLSSQIPLLDRSRG